MQTVMGLLLFVHESQKINKLTSTAYSKLLIKIATAVCRNIALGSFCAVLTALGPYCHDLGQSSRSVRKGLLYNMRC